jgi:hypothetical protein
MIKNHLIRLQPTPPSVEKKSRGRPKSAVYLVNPQLLPAQNCRNRDINPPTTTEVEKGGLGNYAMDSAEPDIQEAGDDQPVY